MVIQASDLNKYCFTVETNEAIKNSAAAKQMENSCPEQKSSGKTVNSKAAHGLRQRKMVCVFQKPVKKCFLRFSL